MATNPQHVRQRRAFANAPGFRATGRGYFNAIPNAPATQANSNLHLVNSDLPVNNFNRDIWIYCTGISTGWSVAGDYGQSAAARTFYPKNLSQDEIQIEGVVANQYEYDRLVEFTIQHHRSMLDTFDHDTDPNTPAQNNGPLELRLYPYLIDTGKRTRKGEIVYREVYGGLPGAGVAGTNGVKLQGVISGIDAGHDRFVNAKSFQFSFRVTYDFMAKPVFLKGELNKQLQENYMVSFGHIHAQASPVKKVIQPKPADGSGFQDTPSIWDQAAAQGVDTSALIDTRK